MADKLIINLLGIGILFFLPLSWLGFVLPKYILIALVFLLFFIQFSIKGKKIYVRSVIFKLVIVYFAVLFIFTLFSGSPLSSFLGISGSMQGFQTALLYLGAFLFAICLSKESEKYFLKVLKIVHIIAGSYALLQWLRLDPLQFLWDNDMFLHRTFSFFGNPNWLAAFMVLTMPLLFSVKKNLPWVLIFEWFVLFSTGSKAGFLAGLLLMIFLLWQKGYKKFLLFIPFIVLGILASLFVLYPDFALLLRSLMVREIVWIDTFKIIQHWPWGHGLDLFTFIYPHFASPGVFEYEDIGSIIDYPHNQSLQLIFESGLFGFIFFFTLVCSIVWFYIKKYIIKDRSSSHLEWGIIAYLVTNFFGFDTLATGVIFWLLLGIMARSDHPLDVSFFKRLSFMSFGILCMFMMLLNMEHLYADFFYDQGWQYLKQNKPVQSINSFERAISIYAYDRVYLLQASETILALDLPIPEQLEKVDQYLLKTENMSNGLDPEITILRAWYYAHQKNSVVAEQYFNQAINNNPYKLRNYLIGFQIFNLLKEPKRIEEIKSSLKDLLPSYWDKPETESGRIFQKNYPWIREILQ